MHVALTPQSLSGNDMVLEETRNVKYECSEGLRKKAKELVEDLGRFIYVIPESNQQRLKKMEPSMQREFHAVLEKITVTGIAYKRNDEGEVVQVLITGKIKSPTGSVNPIQTGPMGLDAEEGSYLFADRVETIVSDINDLVLAQLETFEKNIQVEIEG